MSRSSAGGNGESVEQKRKESMISVMSDPNAGTVKSKKTFVSKHFDFRFSREKLLEIKRGMWRLQLRSSGADSFL
jgi:hypothetical protein